MPMMLSIHLLNYINTMLNLKGIPMNNKLLLASSIATAMMLTACGGSDNKKSNNNNNANGGGADAAVCANAGGVVNPQLTVNDTPVCDLSKAIVSDTTLTTDYVYRLTTYVNVGAGSVEIANEAQVNEIKAAGATLTIDPGVQFRSEGRGTLIVTRGSKIMANGTADAPIVMSSIDDGYEGRGEWGGLVVQGFAPNNNCGEDMPAVCNTADEAGTGNHGGNVSDDNSGQISYLIVTEGGYEVAKDEEINGITLHSVGSGTTIENVMVNANQDDGIEFFGGTVNVKNLILTDNGDESIDWDDGYQGNVQFALVRQGISAKSDHGIEADSEGAKNVPFAYPTIANVTFQVVNATFGEGEAAENGADDLFRFKKGTGVNLVNVAAEGYVECFKIGNDTTGQNEGAPLRVTNVVADSCSSKTVSLEDGAEGNYEADGSDLFIDASGNVEAAADLIGTVTLDDAFALTAEQGNLTVDVAVAQNTAINADFLMNTNYIGAVAPGTAKANAWYAWAEAVIPSAFE